MYIYISEYVCNRYTCNVYYIYICVYTYITSRMFICMYLYTNALTNTNAACLHVCVYECTAFST